MSGTSNPAKLSETETLRLKLAQAQVTAMEAQLALAQQQMAGLQARRAALIQQMQQAVSLHTGVSALEQDGAEVKLDDDGTLSVKLAAPPIVDVPGNGKPDRLRLAERTPARG